MNLLNNEDNESKSIILDLESLSAKYKNLLIQYKQAVLNYVNYLKQEANTPCGKYSSTSTNIDQQCYNEIWKKGGCTTPARKLSTMPGSSSTTLYDWIKDTFIWATNKDSTHRLGCYGDMETPYTIIGVGKYDGNLYSRDGLNGKWAKINDNSNGNLISICTGSDGKSLLGINKNNQIITKPSWNSPTWSSPISCTIGAPLYTEVKFLSIAQALDGTLVGVGMDHQLWTAPALYNSQWNNVGTSEWETSVCIGPNGRLIVGNGTDIYYKDSYKNLQSQTWKYGCPGCCQDITVAQDGTFIDAGACNDYQIWTMDSYLNLNGQWKGPYPSSCCIIGITTITNNNYSPSKYKTDSQPNFNVDSQPLISLKGQAFWGTGSIGDKNPYTNIKTLNECKALCSSTGKCSGATFNETDHGQPMCWLRTGETNPITSLPNDYAIIPQGKQLLIIVQDINSKLAAVNEEIQKQTNNGQPLYKNQSIQRKFKTTELINQFVQLTKERTKIEEMISKYQTLDQKEKTGNLIINQNFYSFLLLKALVIIIILFILYKFFIQSNTTSFVPVIENEGKLGFFTYYIIFGIVCLILFFYYYKINNLF